MKRKRIGQFRQPFESILIGDGGVGTLMFFKINIHYFLRLNMHHRFRELKSLNWWTSRSVTIGSIERVYEHISAHWITLTYFSFRRHETLLGWRIQKSIICDCALNFCHWLGFRLYKKKIVNLQILCYTFLVNATGCWCMTDAQKSLLFLIRKWVFLNWLQLAPELALVGWVHRTTNRTLEHFREGLTVLQDADGTVFARAVRFFGILFVAVSVEDFAPNLSLKCKCALPKKRNKRLECC